MVIGEHFGQENVDEQIKGAHEPARRSEPVARDRLALMLANKLSYPSEINPGSKPQDQRSSSHGCKGTLCRSDHQPVSVTVS